jgi:spermidine synthase
MWSFQYGIKGELSPKKLSNSEEVDLFVETNGLRYYNSDVHVGTFATPNFVKELLKSPVIQ